jgi:hypothetical protein
LFSGKSISGRFALSTQDRINGTAGFLSEK